MDETVTSVVVLPSLVFEYELKSYAHERTINVSLLLN
jgi:hypothetical protein